MRTMTRLLALTAMCTAFPIACVAGGADGAGEGEGEGEGEGACGPVDVNEGTTAGALGEPCGPAPESCVDGLVCAAGRCRSTCEDLECEPGASCQSGVCVPTSCECDVVCAQFNECGSDCRPPACEGDVCRDLDVSDEGEGGEGEGEPSDDACVVVTRPCEAGLVCAKESVDATELRCRAPAQRGESCFLHFEEIDPCAPPLECSFDDVCDFPCGCEPPLACNADGNGCAAEGEIDAPCDSDAECASGFCHLPFDADVARCRPDDCGGFSVCTDGRPCVLFAESRVCGCDDDADCLDGETCTQNSVCRPVPGVGDVCYAASFDDEEDVDVFETPCQLGLECAEQESAAAGFVDRRCIEPQGLDALCLLLPVDEDGCQDGLRCVGIDDQVQPNFVAGQGTCVDANAVGQPGDPCDPDVEDICQGDLVCAPATERCEP